jgi:hypothetical protein
LLAQARGTARITAAYRGDSHYLSASATPLTRNVLGVPLYGFSAQVSGAEPSQAGYGIWVAPVMNTNRWNTSDLILPNYHQPTGFVYASDGVNSCSVAANAAANPSCFLNTPAAGTRAITVSYSGDDMWEPATAPPIWHSTSSAGGANTLPPQTQICGFDPKATYAAQTGFVPIEQLASAVPSMGLVPGVTGNQPLTVAVTSPAENSTTSDGMVDVVGTFTGPANTGITVNGIIANTLNGQFVANNVPLDPGANTLNVVATTLPGATASADVSVMHGGTPGPISISIADSVTNIFAPASIGYNYALAPLPSGAAVSSIRIDYGTVADPWVGSGIASAPPAVSYSVPGVYALTLRVVDSQGNTYTAQRTVLVQDLVAKRSMLCDVYGYLKDRLNAQDAIGAASVYQPLIHDQYQNQFIAFDSVMPGVSSQLGTIATGRLAQSYADMTLVRDNADQTRSGFPLRMTQGSDGVWRISEM